LDSSCFKKLTFTAVVSREALETANNRKCRFHPKPDTADSEHCTICKGTLKTSTGCQRPSGNRHSFTETVFDASNRTYYTASAGNNLSENSVVVIDCEMVELAFGREAVSHLSAIDFFTGEVLIDSHISIPKNERVTDWRTRYTGIDAEGMAEAESQGRTLDGIEGARAELFKFISASSTIVGFAVHNDLEALRICHPNIVDFQLLFKMKAGGRRRVGLKASCLQLLQITVQNHGANGEGHDCLEDVWAARELVLCWIQRKGKVWVR